MDSEEVLGHLRASGALHEGHFELSSGRHSDRYFQCALLLSEPTRAGACADALARKIETGGERPTVVLGPAMGAVVWAHEVARALGVRSMFCERVDGTFRLRRGFHLDAGQPVLVVEDVMTTGGSALEAVELVRSLGAHLVGVACLVNRSGKPNPVESADAPFFELAAFEASSWEASDCPQCAQGLAPIKPGSRPGGAATTEDSCAR